MKLVALKGPSESPWTGLWARVLDRRPPRRDRARDPGSHRREQDGGARRRRESASYFSVKGSGASRELQLFPRMGALRTWTCLRRDGLSGLPLTRRPC